MQNKMHIQSSESGHVDSDSSRPKSKTSKCQRIEQKLLIYLFLLISIRLLPFLYEERHSCIVVRATTVLKKR